jgi:AbrB family looped-hinge helix DNA binding protein
MKEIVSTVTGKGQVTIPSEVRRRLGVAPASKVVFVLADDGTVELRPDRYGVADLRGVVPALDRPDAGDFDAQIREAVADGADRAAAELADPGDGR